MKIIDMLGRSARSALNETKSLLHREEKKTQVGAEFAPFADFTRTAVRRAEFPFAVEGKRVERISSARLVLLGQWFIANKVCASFIPGLRQLAEEGDIEAAAMAARCEPNWPTGQEVPKMPRLLRSQRYDDVFDVHAALAVRDKIVADYEAAPATETTIEVTPVDQLIPVKPEPLFLPTDESGSIVLDADTLRTAKGVLLRAMTPREMPRDLRRFVPSDLSNHQEAVSLTAGTNGGRHGFWLELKRANQSKVRDPLPGKPWEESGYLMLYIVVDKNHGELEAFSRIETLALAHPVTNAKGRVRYRIDHPEIKMPRAGWPELTNIKPHIVRQMAATLLDCDPQFGTNRSWWNRFVDFLNFAATRDYRRHGAGFMQMDPQRFITQLDGLCAALELPSNSDVDPIFCQALSDLVRHARACMCNWSEHRPDPQWVKHTLMLWQDPDRTRFTNAAKFDLLEQTAEYWASDPRLFVKTWPLLCQGGCPELPWETEGMNSVLRMRNLGEYPALVSAPSVHFASQAETVYGMIEAAMLPENSTVVADTDTAPPATAEPAPVVVRTLEEHAEMCGIPAYDPGEEPLPEIHVEHTEELPPGFDTVVPEEALQEVEETVVEEPDRAFDSTDVSVLAPPRADGLVDHPTNPNLLVTPSEALAIDLDMVVAQAAEPAPAQEEDWQYDSTVLPGEVAEDTTSPVHGAPAPMSTARIEARAAALVEFADAGLTDEESDSLFNSGVLTLDQLADMSCSDIAEMLDITLGEAQVMQESADEALERREA